MTYEEAMTSVMNDGINLGAGDYLPIETLYKCKEVLEKQIPKKPVGTEDFIRGCCPNCQKYIDDDFRSDDFKFCQFCGQAIDWGDAE